jgi:hypothetical protein
MSRGIIYLILNKQNGHKYIGNTTLAMNKEWSHHIERSKRMSSESLHKAFREFGTHNFMIKEIDECDESEFESKTTYWIQKYIPEYNDIPIPVVVEVPIPIVEVPKISGPKKPKPEAFIPWSDTTRGTGKHFGFKIRGKNLETGRCSEYESARDAADAVTGNPKNNSNILLAARTGRTAYGHKWQILESKELKRAVIGVNKRTQQIDTRYESISEALRAYECTDKNPLLKSLKHPGRYSWKGNYWFYINHSYNTG